MYTFLKNNMKNILECDFATPMNTVGIGGVLVGDGGPDMIPITTTKQPKKKMKSLKQYIKDLTVSESVVKGHISKKPHKANFTEEDVKDLYNKPIVYNNVTIKSLESDTVEEFNYRSNITVSEAVNFLCNTIINKGNVNFVEAILIKTPTTKGFNLILGHDKYYTTLCWNIAWLEWQVEDPKEGIYTYKQRNPEWNEILYK